MKLTFLSVLLLLGFVGLSFSTVLSVTHNSPENGLNTTATTIEFNYTGVSDSDLTFTSCDIFIDDVLNTTTLLVANGTQTNFTIEGFAEGNHNDTIQCTDSAATPVNSSTDIFTVDATVPVTTLNSPEVDLNTSSGNIEFNFTTVDNLATTMNCSLFIDDVLNTTNSSVSNDTLTNFSITGVNESNHNWTVQCTDNAGNSANASEVRNFTIDSTAPVVTLDLPSEADLSAATSKIFNFTATDNNASTMNCSLFIDDVLNTTNDSVSNNTGTQFSISGLADGNHNWTVQCADTVQNTANASEVRNFTIDSTAPNQSNASTTNGTSTIFTLSSLSQGRYNWLVQCADTVQNTANSSARNFTVDTTAPTVSLVSPVNLTNTTNTTVYLSFNQTDNLYTATNCSLFVNDAYNQSNASTANATTTTFTLSSLSDGHYKWLVQCADPAGNKANSSARNFTVDTTSPVVNLLAPTNALSNDNTTWYFTFNTTDDLSPTMNCSLYVNSVLNQTNSSVANDTNTVFTVSSLPSAAYNWSVGCTDDVSYTTNSSNRSFTVTLATSSNSGGGSNNNNNAAPLLSLNLNPSCTQNTLTVRSNGDEISNARVTIIDQNGAPVFAGLSDSNGQVQFQGCGFTVDVSASKSGYQSTDLTQSLLNCGVCTPPTPVPPTTPPSVEQNQTSVNTTNETIQPPVTNETNQSTTPVQPSLTAPPSGSVGQAVTVSTDCSTCTIQVKGPDGKFKNYTPDSTGKVVLPLSVAGGYQLSLLGPDGTTLKTLNVNAAS
ncbi:MAG: hypothetical protein HZC29_01465, partial [Thaumarchaeota archaeon]|nr:hypothetical protein [Nitrososphaerota archaeon]